MELNEAKKYQLIDKTKKSDDYKDTSKGRNRYYRRVHSHIIKDYTTFNYINFNDLFRLDRLTFDLKVQGEEDEYICSLRFRGLCDKLADEVERSRQFTNRTIDKVIRMCIEAKDVRIKCSCPDFKYRQNFFATKGEYEITKEKRPSDITNPHDTKGGGCKHIMLVLTDLSWVSPLSKAIYNYILYIKRNEIKQYEVIEDLLFKPLKKVQKGEK